MKSLDGILCGGVVGFPSGSENTACKVFQAKEMQVNTDGKSQKEVIKEGISRFKDFLKGIGVPSSMSESGITEEDLPAILDGVVRVSFGSDGYLSCNPPISKEDVMDVLKLAL